MRAEIKESECQETYCFQKKNVFGNVFPIDLKCSNLEKYFMKYFSSFSTFKTRPTILNILFYLYCI